MADSVLDRSLAPEVHEMGQLTLPPLETVVTPVGTRIHIVSGGEAEVTQISATLRGGIAEVPSAELPPLIAPMWIEGTHTMSSSEIADFFDYRGAWIKSDMGIHRLSLTVNALNSNVGEILSVIDRIINEPAFSQDELDQVVRTTANRLRVEQSKVSWIAADNLRRLVYGPENPLSQSPSPDLLEGVRSRSLLDYYSSVLNPENIEFFVSGKVSDKIVTDLENLCKTIPATGEFVDFSSCRFDSSDTCRRIHAEKPDSRQTAVRMGLVLPGRSDNDFVSLRLLVIALGGYFGSRLMMNIREDKGLTYGINAVTLGYADNALMSISSETDASNVESLISETIAEINRMKDPASYSDDEMERLRSLALTNLAAKVDTPLAVMDHYQSSMLAGAPDNYFELQEQAVRSMTPESLASLAVKYFDTSKLYISTAGK